MCGPGEMRSTRVVGTMLLREATPLETSALCVSSLDYENRSEGVVRRNSNRGVGLPPLRSTCSSGSGSCATAA